MFFLTKLKMRYLIYLLKNRRFRQAEKICKQLLRQSHLIEKRMTYGWGICQTLSSMQNNFRTPREEEIMKLLLVDFVNRAPELFNTPDRKKVKNHG